MLRESSYVSSERYSSGWCSLEIYFKDSRSLLIVLLDQKRRSEIDHRLTTIIARHSPEQFMNPNILKSPMFGKMSQIVLSGLKSDELASATRKWQARDISNVWFSSYSTIPMLTKILSVHVLEHSQSNIWPYSQ